MKRASGTTGKPPTRPGKHNPPLSKRAGAALLRLQKKIQRQDPATAAAEYDFSGRKVIEDPAAQERRFSDALIDSLPGVFYLYDSELKFQRWNRNFERVTGYTGTELRRMSPLELFTGPDRARVEARIREVFKRGYSDVEADLVAKDGTSTPYYFTGLRTELAGKSYLLGVGIDLTELRHTQQQLLDSEQRLREIFEAANVGIGVAGANDRFVEVNRGFCEILGYSREEMLRLHTHDLVHPDDVADNGSHTPAKRKGETAVDQGVRRYLRKDGTAVWVSVFARHLFDTEGRSRYSVGVIMDVTERLRAEAALRESEHRYELANRATFNVIWDWNLQTDTIWWNENFLSLFGYRPEQVEPGIESWTNRIHPDDVSRVTSGIHAAIKSGRETWFDVYRFRRGDSVYAEIEDRGHITRDAGGRPVRMIGAMQDITDRKRAEADLRKSEEHLRLALDAAKMATFDWDMQSGTVRWSHTANNWFGMQPGTIEGPISDFVRFVHEDDRAGMWQAIQDCIASHSNYAHEYRLVWPDRSVHWIQALASFGIATDGTPQRMRGVALETTGRKQAEEALKLFRTLVDRANDAIEVIDPVSGRFLDVNDRFCQDLGYTRAEVMSMGIADVDPTLTPDSLPAKALALQQAESLVADGWHRRKDGSLFPVEISMTWVHLDRDYIVASVRDITDRRQAEQSIRRLSRIHAVLSGINSLIVRERDRQLLFSAACQIIVDKGQFAGAWIGTLDPNAGHITLVAIRGSAAAMPAGVTTLSMAPAAPAARGIVGRAVATREPAQIDDLSVEADPHIRLLGLHDSGYRSAIALPLLTRGNCAGVLVLYATDPGVFDIGEQKLLAELADDISFALEYMESGEQIRHMAYHDPLTGLANRSYLLARLQETVEEARVQQHACALLLMNLNNFHSVNNTLGHHNGDLLLRQVAERLRRTVWETDVVACLGGDEFAILLPKLANSDDVDLVVKKITAGNHEAFLIADLPVSVEPRLGYAMFPAHADSAELLWQRASVALRAAKEGHRTTQQYDTGIDHYDARKLALLSNLRAAIDDNQLLLHYQPKVDLRTMTVNGVEALVRWQHPQHGLIYPDQFIPLAEQTTLIAPMTMWILATAMNQGSAWIRQGLHLDLAINLSARNIHDPNLCADILELARTSGFPVQRLILEITESAIMADPDQGKAVLTRLGEAGISISMDDFGIGQSSLAYLKDLPVNQVKIDKTFVMEIHEPRNLAIVRATIELARNMGLQVTAEGIENDAALQILRTLGCDQGQGYHFSKPLPPDRVPAWLNASPWKGGGS